MGRKKKQGTFPETQLKHTDDSFMDSIVERFGDNILSNIRGDRVDVMTTGSLSLDASIGIGGIPKGRFTEIYGPEGCLSGGTFIQYSLVHRGTGEIVSKHGGTLKSLYNKFHQKRLELSPIGFKVSSVAEDGRVIRNPVVDVVYSGVKETYLVKTEYGNSIICTKDHKFLTNVGLYAPLEQLDLGSIVFIHNNTTVESPNVKTKPNRPELLVKYHPNRKTKEINGSTYYRVPLYHMIYEAYRNQMSLDEYRNVCNRWDKTHIDNLWTIPDGHIIHHKDENFRNNEIANLQLMTKLEHDIYHANKNIRNLSYIVVADRIVSIEPYGNIDTYDIKCYAPNNNYIANGIVVHNSGKTTIALTISKYALQRGERVLYVDVENMLSYDAIKSILGENLPKDRFLLLQPETAEDAFMIIEKGITSDEFSLIVLDSVAALEPQVEKDNEFDDQTMALLSRLLAKFFRRNAADVKNHNVAVLLINQVRDKVGSYTGGYSSPGGHALKHYASLIIPLTKGTDIKVGDTKVGISTRFLIKKNKMASPFRSYELPIIFGKGIDFFSDTVSFCETLGVIQKSGPHYSFEDVSLGKGKIAAAAFLQGNKEILDKIVERVYNVLNKEPVLKSDEELNELEGETDA